MFDMWFKLNFDWNLNLFIQDGGQLKPIQKLNTHLIFHHRLKRVFVKLNKALLGVISILYENLGRFTKSNLVNIFDSGVQFESQSS